MFFTINSSLSTTLNIHADCDGSGNITSIYIPGVVNLKIGGRTGSAAGLLKITYSNGRFSYETL